MLLPDLLWKWCPEDVSAFIVTSNSWTEQQLPRICSGLRDMSKVNRFPQLLWLELSFGISSVRGKCVAWSPLPVCLKKLKKSQSPWVLDKEVNPFYGIFWGSKSFWNSSNDMVAMRSASWCTLTETMQVERNQSKRGKDGRMPLSHLRHVFQNFHHTLPFPTLHCCLKQIQSSQIIVS